MAHIKCLERIARESKALLLCDCIKDDLQELESLRETNLNYFIEYCHSNAKNKGFWDKQRPISELLMLIVSELAEALEADRNNDKENFKEEIADTFIRLCDLCGGLKIDLESEVVKKMEKNAKRPRLHGKRY